ncbi:hypothetical protein SCHPADRAFT_593283 [Schizopora paradoxa]|uniref:NACHT domain-containing protein n=1 Tax=Schizopora paradoxa TaxID=27342 RepID=A0A0H2RBL3_9AGAM|nr:hypothetical protein SCHPADRAFT_593283 [Schizopora paradoxa]
MWLSGLAGTGKSTLAKTIATWADGRKFLGSSYFFSRDTVELSTSSLVIPTIAHNLSNFDKSLADYIWKKMIEDDNHIFYQEVTDQFKKLIEEPLRLTEIPDISRKHMLLIIDGLDECNNPRDVETIIRLFLDLLSPSHSVKHIRILLVSRPEKHICDALYADNQLRPLITRCTVEDFVDSSDIEQYLRHGLSRFGSDDWLSESDFKALVQSCGKLFIYASTVLGFIGGGRALRSPEEGLQIISAIKSGGASDEAPYKQLDDLYLCILLEAVGNDASASSKAMERFRKILGTIVLVRDHLGVGPLSKLIEEKEQHIWNTLKHLGSIFIVPHEEDLETPVKFFHPSLQDFLTDSNRCEDERFFIDAPNMEGYLFQRCTDVFIFQGLSGTIDDELIPVMRYVCEHWGYHLEKVPYTNAQAIKTVDHVIRCHLLKWFRFSRIICGSCNPLFECMKSAQNWVQCQWVKSGCVDERFDELLGTLDSVLRSSRCLDGIFKEHYEDTYDAARSKCGRKTRPAACHPGTRETILKEIKEWATDLNSTAPNLFLLYGSAMSGKSAIAMSIAEWADKKGILCSGYFFVRNFAHYSKEMWMTICTIAHDLALFDHSMRKVIVGSVEKSGFTGKSLFKHLIAEPLKRSDYQVPILLVIDGVEKCQEAAEFLSLFIHILESDNSRIRILMTTRPTLSISEVLERYKGRSQFANLDDIPDDIVQRDIVACLRHGLAHVHGAPDLPRLHEWPSRSDFDSLVDHSKNSFHYAKYALKFIGNSKARSPAKQLRNWVNGQFHDDSCLDLYPLWLADNAEYHDNLQVVAVVAVSLEPLSLLSLANILQLDIITLQTILRRVYPIIVLGADGHPKPIHPSLRQYLTNKTSEGPIKGNWEERQACLRCLEIMEEHLNCDFPMLPTGRDDSHDTVEVGTNAESGFSLRYACRYWAMHLPWDRGEAVYVLRKFNNFLQSYFLRWLYAMSLHQLVSDAASSMSIACRWSRSFETNIRESEYFKIRSDSLSARKRIFPYPLFLETIEYLDDARQYIENNHQAFAEYPLQVYQKVLDLPESSVVRQVYEAAAKLCLHSSKGTNRDDGLSRPS